MTADTALAIAHRAGNSLDGLHQANLLDVDVVECDVHATGAARGAPPQDRRAAAVPLGPLGAGVGASTTARSGGAPGGRPARRGLHARPQGPSRVHRAGGGRPGARARSGSPGHRAGGTGPRSSGSEQRPRTPTRCCRPAPVVSWLRWSGGSPTRSRPAPYGTSIHVSLLDRALVTTLRRRVSVVMTWPVNDADRPRRCWPWARTA